MSERKFAIFHLRENRVVAVDAVNDPREFMAGKKLFVKAVDPAKLADPSAESKSLAN